MKKYLVSLDFSGDSNLKVFVEDNANGQKIAYAMSYEDWHNQDKRSLALNTVMGMLEDLTYSEGE